MQADSKPKQHEKDVRSSPVPATGRKLNAFEAFFAAFNVRFAVLFLLDDTDEDQDVADLERRLARRIAESSPDVGFSRVQATSEESGDWSKQLSETAHVEVKEIQFRSHGSSFDGLKANTFLKKHVSVDGSIASDPLHINLIQEYTGKSKSLVAIGINASHAIVDGRCMIHMLESLLSELHLPSIDPNLSHLPHALQEDWADLVRKSTVNLPTYPTEPIFLQTASPDLPPLTIQEVLGTTEDEPVSVETHEFLHSISADRMDRTTLKASGVSMTGWMVACFMKVMSEAYGKVDRKVSLSVLVDLRRFLSGVVLGEQNDSTLGVSQAIGTVSLSIDCALFQQGGKSLLSIASGLTSQLRQRVERGEAHTSALRMTEGDFDHASPFPATLELSNLGNLNTLPNGKLFVAQRFDGYDGVSCMAYSTPTQGFVFSTSVGEGLKASRMGAILDRSFALMESSGRE